jgi:hypothetical protein
MLNGHYVPGPELNTFHALTHVIPSSTLEDSTDFIGEETDAQRDRVISPKLTNSNRRKRLKTCV